MDESPVGQGEAGLKKGSVVTREAQGRALPPTIQRFSPPGRHTKGFCTFLQLSCSHTPPVPPAPVFMPLLLMPLTPLCSLAQRDAAPQSVGGRTVPMRLQTEEEGDTQQGAPSLGFAACQPSFLPAYETPQSGAAISQRVVMGQGGGSSRRWGSGEKHDYPP